MLTELLVAATLNCSQPVIENRVDNMSYMKNYKDALFYNAALVRCGQLFIGSPCVKKFIIKLDPWGDRMYNVVCGKDEKDIPDLL